VLGDIAAPLGVLQGSLEGDQYLFRHWPRHALNQLVTEDVDARRRQLRQLLVPYARNDVEPHDLPVSVNRSSLSTLAFDIADPIVGGFCDRYALARGGMDALGNINGDLRLASVRVFLARKRLDITRTVRRVVNDPGFPGLALTSNPFPLANRHTPSPGHMSQYVASNPAFQESSSTPRCRRSSIIVDSVRCSLAALAHNFAIARMPAVRRDFVFPR